MKFKGFVNPLKSGVARAIFTSVNKQKLTVMTKKVFRAVPPIEWPTSPTTPTSPTWWEF